MQLEFKLNFLILILLHAFYGCSTRKLVSSSKLADTSESANPICAATRASPKTKFSFFRRILAEQSYSASLSFACRDLADGSVREEVHVDEKGYFNLFRGPENFANGVYNPVPYASYSSMRDSGTGVARAKVTIFIPPRSEQGRTSQYSYRYILNWIEVPNTLGGPNWIAKEDATVEKWTNLGLVESFNASRGEIIGHYNLTKAEHIGQVISAICDYIRKVEYIEKIPPSNKEFNFLGYDGPFSSEIVDLPDGRVRGMCYADFEGYIQETARGPVRFVANTPEPFHRFEDDSYLMEWGYFDEKKGKAVLLYDLSSYSTGANLFSTGPAEKVDPRGRLTWLDIKLKYPIYGAKNFDGCTAVALVQTRRNVFDKKSFDRFVEEARGFSSPFLTPLKQNRFRLISSRPLEVYRDAGCTEPVDYVYLSDGGRVPQGTNLTTSDIIRFVRPDGGGSFSVEPIDNTWYPAEPYPDTRTLKYH